MAEENTDLYEMLESICPRFKNIPMSEKDVMSRHMAGIGPEGIAAATGRSVKSIAAVIERYSSLVERVPDSMRLELAIKMMVGSISSYAAAISDRKKIDDLSAADAMKVIQSIVKIGPELMNMRVEILEHEKKVGALDYDGFAKSLGAG